MRSISVVLVLVATAARAAETDSDGIDPDGIGLDGMGILIGQAEVGRSGKAGYDSDNMSASNTVPAGVYFQNDSGMAPPDTYLFDEHATLVAQQMIGTGVVGGVAPGASLHSLAISDIDDDVQVALGLNRLALLSSGAVTATNLSFYSSPGAFDNADGNSHFTQFVDWSARKQDVLYVVAWGNIDQPDDIRKPTDNYNGLTVGASERVDGGPYRKHSLFNAIDTNSSDAQRIDILAPGTDILVRQWNETADSRDGTSYAAPHVTGTVALLQQYAVSQMNLDPPMSCS